MRNIFILIVILFNFTSTSSAKDVCDTDKYDFNICKVARNISDDLAPSLPMQLNQNMRLEKTFAIKNIVSMHAVLGYTKQHLEQEASKAGITMKTLEEKMRSTTIAIVCKSESKTSKFIKLGGEIQYIYSYSDYMPYLEIDIKKCT